MLRSLKVYLDALLRGEEGATIIEYALLALLIATGLVASVALIGPALSDIFSDVAQGFN